MHVRKYYTAGDMAEMHRYLREYSTCETLADDLKNGFRVARLAKAHFSKIKSDFGLARYKEFKAYLDKTKRKFKRICKR